MPNWADPPSRPNACLRPRSCALYTIRSEALLVEALDYNLPLPLVPRPQPAGPHLGHTTFSQNQTRLLQRRTAELFFARIVGLAREHGWVGEDHFTVDSTLIDAWASLKSFQPKTGPKPPDGDASNPSVDFHGERRRNATHVAGLGGWEPKTGRRLLELVPPDGVDFNVTTPVVVGS